MKFELYQKEFNTRNGLTDLQHALFFPYMSVHFGAKFILWLEELKTTPVFSSHLNKYFNNGKIDTPL